MTARIQPLALVALAVVIAYWSGVVVGWRVRSVTAQAPQKNAGILTAPAQSEWSHGRIIADPPIIMAVVSRERQPDGAVVGHARQDAYVGAEDENRVADYVIDPGRSYVTACGFQLRDDVTYETTTYLPVVVQRGRPRW